MVYVGYLALAVFVLVVAAVLVLLIREAPGIRRYLHIRKM